MSLHRLLDVEIGVPNVEDTSQYYSDFGLTPRGEGLFATQDGGDQLRITAAPRRCLRAMTVAVDDVDDLSRASAALTRLGVVGDLVDDTLAVREPVAGFTVKLRVAPRLVQPAVAATPYNGPGRIERAGRAPGVMRPDRVRPLKLGHIVVGTTNLEATMSFFTEGLGFKVSDYIGDKGAFMRCSEDHHNFLALAAPVNFLHHTSWQLPDIDDVGRGAKAMLDADESRHVWGLGRHHAGSNFFWYLKDPAGNFSEYYSDMDCIPEQELWEPEVFNGPQGLFNWGPPPPPSFLSPDDLAELMTGAHAPG